LIDVFQSQMEFHLFMTRASARPLTIDDPENTAFMDSAGFFGVWGVGEASFSTGNDSAIRAVCCTCKSFAFNRIEVSP